MSIVETVAYDLISEKMSTSDNKQFHHLSVNVEYFTRSQAKNASPY